MKIFLLFLIFTINTSYSQGSNNFVPLLTIAYSCKSQATLTAKFENSDPTTSYKINWKRNGIIVASQPLSNHLRVTNYGNYSFEVVYGGNEKKESNILVLNEFSESGFKDSFVPVSRLFYARNDTIFSANDKVFFDTNIITKTKYTYYLNDKIVENQESNQFSNINKLKIYKLNFNIEDSLCTFKSKDYVFSNEYKSIIEGKVEDVIFCIGETSKIVKNNATNIYGGDIISIKSDWFKNDSLFSSNDSDFIRAQTALKTNESGVYFLKTTLQMNAGEFILNSEKVNLLFKNEIIIPGNKFARKLCPTIPELSYQLLSLPVEKVTWFQDFSIVQPNQFSIDTLLNTTRVDLVSSGNYSLKVKYKNGCESISENIPFDFENRIQINSLIKKEIFCKNELLSLVDFEEYRNIEFNLFWKLDDEIQVNKLVNKNIFSVEKPGNYQLTARHSGGTCFLNSNVIKIEFPQINSSLNYLDSIQLCKGKSVKLKLSDSTSNILNWYKDNTILNFGLNEIEVTEVGNYYALFKASNCSELSISKSKPLKINEIQKPTANISGTKSIDYNQPLDLKFELTSVPPWQIKLNTGEEFSINESPYTLKVRPINDIKYIISSVENICGLGTSSGEAVIKVTILANETNVEENANLKVFPIPVANAFELELLESNSKNAQIILTNNLGVELQNHFTKTINNQINKTLNINYLPAGIYNLNVKVGSKIYSRKIVKQ